MMENNFFVFFNYVYDNHKMPSGTKPIFLNFVSHSVINFIQVTFKKYTYL